MHTVKPYINKGKSFLGLDLASVRMSVIYATYIHHHACIYLSPEGGGFVVGKTIDSAKGM